MRSSRLARSLWTAVRLTLVLTLVLGVAYPAVVWGIGRVAFPSQAAGSLVRDAAGDVRGSALLGQSFADDDGEPLPRYFQPRPSAAGDGYDATASSGSNLGPEDAGLVASVAERRAAVAAFNGVPEADVPADAVTASGSGLDPHISPAYAEVQVARVAAARGMSQDDVRAYVADATSGRDLGFVGEPRVDVVTLNLALDARGQG
ncbi:potassium-transporting ATPase subunit KdpC [Xylanimonas protaetiae]|uniref:Potassium-transporting ATPase KdpC subunit n=1 Tax=Xylanimonas protaetiae TaxID=2509457 RepID=A0A4P6FE06_9MICO|nr:potassium-transporting ATPase subunit KdpC [Xylanimonas protaetiae]QAY68838.1 potassium-transporting ATPase subunit KdpC [Xylanimonas protaetiae]